MKAIPVKSDVVEEAIEALMGLGYTKYEVDLALEKLNVEEDWASEDIIKESLKILSRAASK